MKLIIKRSGGIAGITKTITVDTTTLSEIAASAVESKVNELFSSTDTTPALGQDRFAYELKTDKGQEVLFKEGQDHGLIDLIAKTTG